MTEPQSPAQQPSRRSWIPLLSHGACHQLKLRQHLQSCLAARQTLLSLPAFSRFFLSSPGTQSVLSHLPYSLTSVAEPRGLPCIPATLSKCHGGGQPSDTRAQPATGLGTLAASQVCSNSHPFLVHTVLTA